MHCSRLIVPLCLVSVIVSMFGTLPCGAATFTWNGLASNPAATNWEDAANWTPAGGPPGPNDIARFPSKGTTYNNPSVNDARHIYQIDFPNSPAGGWVITGKGTLHMGAGGGFGLYYVTRIDCNIVVVTNQVWWLGGGSAGYLDIYGTISGPGHITRRQDSLRPRNDNDTAGFSGGMTLLPGATVALYHHRGLGSGVIKLRNNSLLCAETVLSAPVTNRIELLDGGIVSISGDGTNQRGLTYAGPLFIHRQVALNTPSWDGATLVVVNGPIWGHGFAKISTRNMTIGGTVTLSNKLAVAQGPVTFATSSTGSSIAKGVEVWMGKLVLNAAANLAGNQVRMRPIVPFDVPMYTLRYDGVPSYLDFSASVGMVDVDAATFTQNPA
ncbi:MAG: hypothetical protein N3G20_03195, partial [Verrucomicrobiae bacterium]|nr:hypothetical protein [Verrucomicrobiae bacterium]